MITYQSSGVSIAANDALVRRIQRSLRSTQDRRVITNVNGFAGFYRLFGGGRTLRDPVLVSCSDGVGSKVLIAAKARRLSTIGIDLVAMNVNDLVTSGAEPLFFLDYVALHKNSPRHTAAIVEGVAKGCRLAGCTLLGGETSEMPDVYRKGDFDLAGFAVGVVERKSLITGRRIRRGDVIIGLASSGIHSNGYALVRKLFFDSHKYALSSRLKGLPSTLGAELLRPTRIYVKPLLALLHKTGATALGKRALKAVSAGSQDWGHAGCHAHAYSRGHESPNGWHAQAQRGHGAAVRRRPRSNECIIRGMAHITGGGLVGNVPRILPDGCMAAIEKHSWKIPPIFRIIQSLGVAEQEMYRVFNMGIGMTLIVPRHGVHAVLSHFQRYRIPACPIGRIAPGPNAVELV